MRKQFSEKAIRKHWVDRLWEKKGFDSPDEFMEKGICFACNLCADLEKAHIQALSIGGNDNLENIHLLCKICHKDSEYLEGKKYFDWLYSRNIIDVMFNIAGRKGVNLSQFLK